MMKRILPILLLPALLLTGCGAASTAQAAGGYRLGVHFHLLTCPVDYNTDILKVCPVP